MGDDARQAGISNFTGINSGANAAPAESHRERGCARGPDRRFCSG